MRQRLANATSRQVLAVALVLLATGAIAFVLRDAVREFIVLPLAYLLWLADLVLRSVPQVAFLALLVILAGVLVLRGFGRPASPERRSATGAGVRREATRFGYWVRQFDRCEDSAFASERLAMELRELVARILADEERLSPDEVVARVRDGSLSVPAEVRALMTRPQDWLATGQADPLSRLIRRICAALRLPVPPVAQSELDARLLGVITYIENRLGGSRE